VKNIPSRCFTEFNEVNGKRGGDVGWLLFKLVFLVVGLKERKRERKKERERERERETERKETEQ
jgi:hypothetical protein